MSKISIFETKKNNLAVATVLDLEKKL